LVHAEDAVVAEIRCRVTYRCAPPPLANIFKLLLYLIKTTATHHESITSVAFKAVNQKNERSTHHSDARPPAEEPDPVPYLRHHRVLRVNNSRTPSPGLNQFPRTTSRAATIRTVTMRMPTMPKEPQRTSCPTRSSKKAEGVTSTPSAFEAQEIRPLPHQ
jgi:hypothetical protein